MHCVLVRAKTIVRPPEATGPGCFGWKIAPSARNTGIWESMERYSSSQRQRNEKCLRWGNPHRFVREFLCAELAYRIDAVLVRTTARPARARSATATVRNRPLQPHWTTPTQGCLGKRLASSQKRGTIAAIATHPRAIRAATKATTRKRLHFRWVLATGSADYRKTTVSREVFFPSLLCFYSGSYVSGGKENDNDLNM